MGRLGRFLKLERARGDDGAGDPRGGSRVAGRFDGVAPPPAAPPPVAHDPCAPPPEPADPVDASVPDDERPSTRCVACGCENGRFARNCSACAASLRTAVVARVNRRLWQDERAAVLAARAARAAATGAEVDALADRRRAEIIDTAFARLVAHERRREGWSMVRRGLELVAALAIGALAWFGDLFSLLAHLGAVGWGLGGLVVVVVIGVVIAARRRD